MEQYIQYAPLILAVFVFFVQNNLFVKPEQLEKKHREILEDCEKKFASHEIVSDLKQEIRTVREKIDKIYECVINRNCEE